MFRPWRYIFSLSRFYLLLFCRFGSICHHYDRRCLRSAGSLAINHACSYHRLGYHCFKGMLVQSTEHSCGDSVFVHPCQLIYQYLQTSCQTYMLTTCVMFSLVYDIILATLIFHLPASDSSRIITLQWALLSVPLMYSHDLADEPGHPNARENKLS